MTLFADLYIPFPSSATASSSSKGKSAEPVASKDEDTTALNGLTNAEKQSLTSTTGALGYRWLCS